MKIEFAVITSIALGVLIAGCQQGQQAKAPATERDPMNVQIQFAWGISMHPGNPMGGSVTDDFVIKAQAREPGIQKVKVGDYFKSALNIGTPAKFGKYGGMSGLKFTVTSPPEYTTYYPASGVTHVTWYWVKSEPISIICNNENKLMFTVDGDGVDDIEIRVKTAGMKSHWRIWQNGQPAPIFPDHNSNAKQILRYSCLMSDSSVMVD